MLFRILLSLDGSTLSFHRSANTLQDAKSFALDDARREYPHVKRIQVVEADSFSRYLVMFHIRASGPRSAKSIAAYFMEQHPEATTEIGAESMALAACNSLLRDGKLALYDVDGSLTHQVD